MDGVPQRLHGNHRILGVKHRKNYGNHTKNDGKHTKNYGTSPLLMGKSTISMTIFNSYVSIAISLFMGIQPNPASPNSKKHSKCDRFATYRPEKNVAVDGQDAPRSL